MDFPSESRAPLQCTRQENTRAPFRYAVRRCFHSITQPELAQRQSFRSGNRHRNCECAPSKVSSSKILRNFLYSKDKDARAVCGCVFVGTLFL